VEATITLDGVGLTDLEQRVLVVCHACESQGFAPLFQGAPECAVLRPAADGLVQRGLLYRLHEHTGSRAPEAGGYALCGPTAEWIAETLYASGGYELKDLI
jgi:hypothetical protein